MRSGKQFSVKQIVERPVFRCKSEWLKRVAAVDQAEGDLPLAWCSAALKVGEKGLDERYFRGDTDDLW